MLAADAMAALLAMTVGLTIVAELAMPWIVATYSPGFAATPGKTQLTITLTMITMPYLPCMAIYAHLAGVLNARNRFILSAARPDPAQHLDPVGGCCRPTRRTPPPSPPPGA